MDPIHGAQATRSNIFELAGMSHARLDDATAIIQNRVSGYLRRKDGSLRNSMYADSSLYPASEGAVGSIKDLAAFSAALQANRLVKPAFMQLMTTAYKTTNGKETNYGLGCFVREWEGKRIVGHGGWRRGASSFFLWIPEERLAVCVLANLEQADVKEASLAIARMMLED
ncbi:MAG: serine hydrolase domain-containing protein [Phycisphaerae bacterium]